MRAIVNQLMRFAWSKDKGIAAGDWGLARFIAHAAFAGDHMIEFPLGRMGVVRVGRLPRGDPKDLERERVPRTRIPVGIPAQRFRDIFARALELALGRSPGELL